jgi:uncharacterized protein YkwD
MKPKLFGMIVSAGILLPAAASLAQLALPPSIIQQQAKREQQQAQGIADPANEKRAAAKDQHQQIETLQATALGDDATASANALKQLRNMGEPAKSALREVVGKLLAHDSAIIQSASTLPRSSELNELSRQIADDRKEARTNIDKLSHDDDSIPKAHKFYDSLKANWEKLHGSFARADALGKALYRRGDLVTMWHDLMPADKQYSDDSEAKLAAKAERAFGFTSAQLAAIPDLGQGDAPVEPVLRDIYFYRACRRVEAYNAIVSKCMTAGEQEDFVLVNTYREYLGILPYEIDPRLVQAARDHSQEMVTMKYFAHESPVAGNKTPWDRIGKTGYKGGSGENIYMGSTSGSKAFWAWFDSPGHHQNIASKGSTAMGVGEYGIDWTQDMGAGKRLMLATPEMRREALGGSIKPAPGSASASISTPKAG